MAGRKRKPTPWVTALGQLYRLEPSASAANSGIKASVEEDKKGNIDPTGIQGQPETVANKAGNGNTSEENATMKAHTGETDTIQGSHVTTARKEKGDPPADEQKLKKELEKEYEKGVAYQMQSLSNKSLGEIRARLEGAIGRGAFGPDVASYEQLLELEQSRKAGGQSDDDFAKEARKADKQIFPAYAEALRRTHFLQLEQKKQENSLGR